MNKKVYPEGQRLLNQAYLKLYDKLKYYYSNFKDDVNTKNFEKNLQMTNALKNGKK